MAWHGTIHTGDGLQAIAPAMSGSFRSDGHASKVGNFPDSARAPGVVKFFLVVLLERMEGVEGVEGG